MVARLRVPVTLDAAWVARALNRADAILAAPPAQPHIKRIPPRGRRVQRFALPLGLCPPQNRTRHGRGWRLGKLKDDLSLVMLAQARGRRSAPLPGRPLVRCVRFSAVEPDAYSDWAKLPVDRLTVAKGGLGYLRDDRPRDCEVVQWWERAPAVEGFALLEVWA